MTPEKKIEYMTNVDIEEEMLHLPGDILATKKEILQLYRLIEEKKRTIKVKKDKLLIDITSEKDGEGKVKFTNVSSREAELGIRSYTDKFLKDIHEKISVMKDKHESEKQQLEYFLDRLKVLKYVVMLRCKDE